MMEFFGEIKVFKGEGEKRKSLSGQSTLGI